MTSTKQSAVHTKFEVPMQFKLGITYSFTHFRDMIGGTKI